MKLVCFFSIIKLIENMMEDTIYLLNIIVEKHVLPYMTCQNTPSAFSSVYQFDTARFSVYGKKSKKQ